MMMTDFLHCEAWSKGGQHHNGPWGVVSVSLMHVVFEQSQDISRRTMGDKIDFRYGGACRDQFAFTVQPRYCSKTMWLPSICRPALILHSYLGPLYGKVDGTTGRTGS